MGRSKGSPALAAKALGVYNMDMLYRKADAMDRELGITYYLEFSTRIMRYAKERGFPFQTAAAIYAALSPNNSQESNMEDMRRAMSAARSTDWQNTSWPKLVVHTYGANKAKARRILEGEAPALVLTGEKTWNFFNNILSPSNPEFVTVDGHMVNIWNNQRVPLDQAGLTRSEYRMVASGVQELATRLGLIPCQLQATLWLTWRRIHRIYYSPQYQLNLGE